MTARISAEPVSDAEFVRRFEAAAWPAAEWHHRQHIKIAYLYLRAYSFDEALSRLRSGIQKLNAFHGTPETPTRGYHETMTVAWLSLVAMVVAEYGPAESADAFFDQHPELSQPKALRLFYSRERLMSPEAKTAFATPDLAPLPASTKARRSR